MTAPRWAASAACGPWVTRARICGLHDSLWACRRLPPPPMATRAAESCCCPPSASPTYFAQRHLLRACAEFGADLVLVIQLPCCCHRTSRSYVGAAFAASAGSPMRSPASGAARFYGPWMPCSSRTRSWSSGCAAFGLSSIHHLPQCCDPEIQRPLPLAPAMRRASRPMSPPMAPTTLSRSLATRPLLGNGLSLSCGVRAHLAGCTIQSKATGPDARSWAMKCPGDAGGQIALNTNHYAGIADINKRSFGVNGHGRVPAHRRSLWPSPATSSPVRGRDLRRRCSDLLDKVLLPQPPGQAGSHRANRPGSCHRDHTFVARLRVLLDTRGPDQPLPPAARSWPRAGSGSDPTT